MIPATIIECLTPAILTAVLQFRRMLGTLVVASQVGYIREEFQGYDQTAIICFPHCAPIPWMVRVPLVPANEAILHQIKTVLLHLLRNRER